MRIDVEDDGLGMTPEVRARAFEPFFTTKDVGRGSGLGLPQVHGFTRQSGGGVTLRSRPGNGTVVSLFFQRAEPAPGSREAKAARREAGPRTDILLVEDDPSVLEVMQLMLVDAGHRVVAARNGVDAMALLAGGITVDLLVSDVVMPGGMSGVELAREARRMHPGLGILLVSGYAADVLVRHGAADEFDILHKPYAHAELLAGWRRCGRSGRARAERRGQPNTSDQAALSASSASGMDAATPRARQAGDAVLADAAGHDAGEMRRGRLDVQRHPVPAHPAGDAHADGADLGLGAGARSATQMPTRPSRRSPFTLKRSRARISQSSSAWT